MPLCGSNLAVHNLAMCQDIGDMSAVCNGEWPGPAASVLVCLHILEWLLLKASISVTQCQSW